MDEQIQKTEENTETGRKKFTFSLYSYFAAMCFLIFIALVYFIVQASSGTVSNNELFPKSVFSRPAKSIGAVCQIKTNDEGAQNLLHYVMENPPKASDREHTAKNIQESGIDLYQKNLEYLDDEAADELLPKDSQTLRRYCSLNVKLFSRMKAAVLEGWDPGTLENDKLYIQMQEMKSQVSEIYQQY